MNKNKIDNVINEKYSLNLIFHHGTEKRLGKK